MEVESVTEENLERQPQEYALEILQHFIFDNTKHKVTIVWDRGEPLMRASDIGDVLSLTNVRKSIASFDEDERRVITSYTTHYGPREALFLTETGVLSASFPISYAYCQAFSKMGREANQRHSKEKTV